VASGLVNLLVCVTSLQGDVGAWPSSVGTDSVATLQRGAYFVYATNVTEERIELRVFSVQDRKVIKSFQIPSAKFAISADERLVIAYSPKIPRGFDVFSLEDGKHRLRLVNGHKKVIIPLTADAPEFCVGSEGAYLYAYHLDGGAPQRWSMADLTNEIEKRNPRATIPGEPWALKGIDGVNHHGELIVRKERQRYFAKPNREGTQLVLGGPVLDGNYSSSLDYVVTCDDECKTVTLRSESLPEKAIFQVPTGKIYPNCKVYAYPFSVSRVMLMVVPEDGKTKVCFVDVVRKAANDIRCIRTEYEMAEFPGSFQFRCRGWFSLFPDDEIDQFFFPESEVENIMRQKATRVRRYEHPLPAVEP
jgi:hypothetical protein